VLSSPLSSIAETKERKAFRLVDAYHCKDGPARERLPSDDCRVVS